MKKCLLLLLLFLLTACLPIMANASDTSLANYEATVTISNNSTAATNVAVPFTLSVPNMVTAGYIDTACTRVAMTDSTDAVFMPGYNTNPWVVFVPSIGADATVRDSLYTANTSLSSTKSYFPGATGMAVADNAILEPAANFTIGLTDTFIDTSVADKLAFKNEAISLLSNGTGNITGAILGGIDAGSAASDRASACVANQTWLTLNNPANANGIITSISVWSNTATSIVVGTFYGSGVSWTCRDYETITVTTGSAQTKAVNLTTETGDILGMFATANHVDVEQPGGIGMLQYGGNGTTGGAHTYTPQANYIASIYATGYSISVTSAVATGEHDITLAANSTNLTLTVDGSIVANSALGGASVPDNANYWQIGSTSTLYITSANITVGGALKGSWAWMYGSTFTDLSGNGRTATPTFRTTSSDADVSASISSFTAIGTATAPSYTVTEQGTFYTGNITATGNFTSDTTMTGGPAVLDVVEDMATAGAIPPSFLWGIIGCFVCAASGLGLSYARKKGNIGGGYVFIMLIIGIITFALLIAFKKFDPWMLWFYLIIAGGIAMASRHMDWGGSTSQHSIIGFLAMAWVGLTLINRILEGTFITAAETSYLNTVTFTKAFSLLNLFTIPIMNWDFFTVGIPSLLRWDYSFFGGQAQIVQYMLYSITAVVSFIIFGIILGLVYSAITRST